ncbi:methyltransferase domain-containing protein [Kitasatospora sp. NPDC085879]|uniref:class I SAM-dependent methyltransferase n=1 Tax=Kitasatospora sp. NPDC085879 TaxID=3154769 RepID=UPI003418ADBD
MADLVGDAELAASGVVANSTMNRGRTLTGVNSYARELGFDPAERLRGRPGAWLDLCSGEGLALLAAAAVVADGSDLTGVDLVGPLGPVPAAPGLRLVTASVADWEPERAYDLVTCVHGLPYLGDKLGLLARWAGALTEDGLLAATFDPASVRRPDGRSAARPVLAALRAAGFAYSPRRRLLTLHGRRRLPAGVPGFRYLGADPAAGPNWTGQPAVASYYA